MDNMWLLLKLCNIDATASMSILFSIMTKVMP